MMMDGVIETWIHLCDDYATFTPHMLQKAEDAYRICVGGDVTLDEMVSKPSP